MTTLGILNFLLNGNIDEEYTEACRDMGAYRYDNPNLRSQAKLLRRCKNVRGISDNFGVKNAPHGNRLNWGISVHVLINIITRTVRRQED